VFDIDLDRICNTGSEQQHVDTPRTCLHISGISTTCTTKTECMLHILLFVLIALKQSTASMHYAGMNVPLVGARSRTQPDLPERAGAKLVVQ
jgi:hypothetical protein